MCGICGIVGPGGPDTEARVRRMMARMQHRGPDGEGIWLSDDGRVALGHVRLAIVDTSDAGRQPMHHPAGLHEVVNGEFYNYPDLRRRVDSGAPYLSHCDSEILLHGYARHGEAFIRELNGMFAFALFDERAGRVVLGRDRLGIKPLYYCRWQNEIVFASEIKALFAALPVNTWTIDRQGLSEYLCYQSPLGEKTLFEGIRQVRPGHILSVPVSSPALASASAFWVAQPSPQRGMTFGDAVSEFDETFRAGVERHLLSDVPVASYLSAGFDSTSVFAQACADRHRRGEATLAAYTGCFDYGNGWYDETGPAAEVAAKFGATHRPVKIAADDLAANLDDVIDALDEPRMGMGAFSQYMVAKAAAREFKVILTGHGGDELFAGYPVFKFAQRGLHGMTRLSEVPHFAYFFLSALKGRGVSEHGRGLPVLWSLTEQAGLLRGSALDTPPWQELEAISAREADPVNRMTLTYLTAYLPGLLIVEDKISMAHSLESRTPILDNALVDFSLRVPNDIKLDSGRPKAIIKAFARSRLPESYFHQPKRGFPTPLRHWLRGPLSDNLKVRLGRSEYLSELLDPAALAGVLETFGGSWRRHVRPLDEVQSHRMWQLLSLEAWMRSWSQKYGVTLRLT